MVAIDFPVWLRAFHYLNLLFISLLIRSGLEILSAHPKLYWDDNSQPDTQWLKLTKKEMPKDRLWTSRDEEEPFSSWVALPGHNNLGVGRHWHFLIDGLWVLVGLAYYILLFATGEWRRIIPTSWSVFPAAWRTFLVYASFHVVESPAYNPLQQLAYTAVVFLLAPLTILTGVAMSPAVSGHFPGYTQLFGGRQSARSIHFLCLVAFVIFTLLHTAMVLAHGLSRELGAIALGQTVNANLPTALVIGLGGLVILVLINYVVTAGSLRWPRWTQNRIGSVLDPVRWLLFHHLTSRQAFTKDDISTFFRVNGRPPADGVYSQLAANQFKNYALEVGGLVEKPLRLSLEDLAQMPRQTQITKHVCIQGWTNIAEWAGVPLSSIMDLCHPLPSARYVVLRAFDDKSKSEPHPAGPGFFYGTIDIELAKRPQTILADEMNYERLPVPHGAPLRLRVETQLGFKMVKYIRSIEFVEDYRDIGEGQGGWREDNQHYSTEAGI